MHNICKSLGFEPRPPQKNNIDFSIYHDHNVRPNNFGIVTGCIRTCEQCAPFLIVVGWIFFFNRVEDEGVLFIKKN